MAGKLSFRAADTSFDFGANRKTKSGRKRGTGKAAAKKQLTKEQKRYAITRAIHMGSL